MGKAKDYNAFLKWVTDKGYAIGHSKKHHVLLDRDGNAIDTFAISHKQGGKRYIKAVYVTKIERKIGI